MSPNLSWIIPLAPEAIVVVTALAVVFADLAFLRQKKFATRSGWLCGVTVLGATLALVIAACAGGYRNDEMLTITPFTQFLKGALLIMAIIVAALSSNMRFTRHIGEYFALLLFALSGLMLLISSQNLLMIFLALELLSAPLYVLTAFNKTSPLAAEAALKYFLIGGVSAAFTLFGLSLIYGVAGDLQLSSLAAKLRGGEAEPVCYLALVMTLAGIGFKIAASPFHFWAPDVYEGAPTPIATFAASASKIGGFFVLAVVVSAGFGPLHGSAGYRSFTSGWLPVIAVLSVLSMIVGNFAALAQSNLKRLLAYSAIAHGGYALLAFFGSGSQMLPALFFYVITYALTVLGAFAVVIVAEESGIGSRLSDWSGLARRAPLLSACMFIFMLSLAGIPPLSGFFGKFYLFTVAAAGAPRLGMLWLVIAAVSASAVSLYYYLQVLKRIYAADPPGNAPAVYPSITKLIPIVALAVAVVAFGCAPGWLLGKLSAVINSSVF
jgi:NADH-quinone oxidoreductase subunit N